MFDAETLAPTFLFVLSPIEPDRMDEDESGIADYIERRFVEGDGAPRV